MNLMSLLKYASLKSDELTAPVIADIASAFGHKLNADDVNVAAFADAMRAGDASTVADILNKPALWVKFAELAKTERSRPEEKQELTRICKVCDLHFPVTITGVDAERGYAQAACPRCETEYHVTPDGLNYAV